MATESTHTNMLLGLRIFTYASVCRYRLRTHNKSSRRQFSKTSHLLNFCIRSCLLASVDPLRPHTPASMRYAKCFPPKRYTNLRAIVCKFLSPLLKLCSPSLGGIRKNSGAARVSQITINDTGLQCGECGQLLSKIC